MPDILIPAVVLIGGSGFCLCIRRISQVITARKTAIARQASAEKEAARQEFNLGVLIALNRLCEKGQPGLPREVWQGVQNALEKEFTLESIYDVLEDYHRKGFVDCSLIPTDQGERRSYKILTAGV